MLDHDELLPEEQAYPDFVQELQTTYEMKPEEKQVLTRVHERLAQRSHPHPLLEPVQAGGHTRSPQLPPTVSPPSWPTTSRQRWLRHLNTLVAALFVGLLVAIMVFTFSSINRTGVGSPPATVGLTNGIRVLLVPAEKGSTPSQAEMEATRILLSQRFISFGLQGSSVRVLTVNGQPGILVQLPHFGGNEQQTSGTLLETGALAFWDTGPYATVPVGTPFNPGPYTQYNPDSKPRFTNQDLDPTVLAVFRDSSTGLPAINFMMKGDALKRFQRYTANNIGHSLTITLDGKVIESAIIHSSIAGPFEVSADFTQQQASAIVSVLEYGPLPVELKKLI
jgi:hypothetical protein